MTGLSIHPDMNGITWGMVRFILLMVGGAAARTSTRSTPSDHLDGLGS
jgi:hypothetical protein